MQTVILEALRFIPLLFLLGYAAYQDHKTGYVKNKVWFYAPIGLTLTIISLIAYPQLTTLTLTSIIVTTVLSLTLFYFGAWGGADAKALITIALCTPLTPLWHTPVTYLPILAIITAGPLALMYILVKQPKNLLKAKIRYLPFILTGYIITLIIF